MVRKKGRTTGIHREKGERKERKHKLCCVRLVFNQERPRHEAQGGPGRRGSAQGPSNTSIGPAQGHGSRRQLTWDSFPAPAHLISTPASVDSGDTLSRRRPHRGAQGGPGRRGSAQGPSNTSVGPAQGHGSRRQLTWASFPAPAH